MYILDFLPLNLQTTPVEIFGVPLNDSDLLDADPKYLWAACRPYIPRGTDEKDESGSTETLRSFLRVLAGLDPKDQDKCFKAIVDTLRKASEFGFIHVVERLEEGKSTLPVMEKVPYEARTRLVIGPVKTRKALLEKRTDRRRFAPSEKFKTQWSYDKMLID